MVQYQAGYVLGAIKNLISTYEEDKELYPQIKGLLNNLSTFEVSGLGELHDESVHPILAVVNNIITRGLPTLASEYVEEAFSTNLQLTESQNSFGSIRFPFVRRQNLDELKQAVFKSLHLVDPRAQNRTSYLNISDTDSQFERDFLLQYLPQSQNFLAQLFQHQRSRSTLVRENNHGRVDFSLEIPYFHLIARENRYRQQVEVKCRSCYVVEVDGRAYHNDLVDDLKDFEIGQLPRNIGHIRQDTAYQDAQRFLNSLTTEKYIQTILNNFHDLGWLTNKLTSLVLSPFLIARVQKTFIEYLIRNQATMIETRLIRLAVIERDLPAGHIAVTDLLQHLNTLNVLAGNQLVIPEVHLSVFASAEFVGHPLRSNSAVRLLDECDPALFDLVLDISILRRSGIFSDDSRFVSDHTFVIRSSHFTHPQNTNPIYCSQSITYRPVVREIENEVYEDISESKSLLKYFLRNIFRKEEFREGQLPILNRALQLKSVIGLLPTGGGKSLTYQLAAILQPGITIVVDPIRSLMVDQYRGLKDIGIDRCEFINSTLSAAEKRYNQNKFLPCGQLQFVFVSPERFVIQEFRDALATAAANRYFFSYVVIDEVHCVSEWGHDFRTPYLNLGLHGVKFCRTCSGQNIPLYGLTATASFDVLADIERELQIPNDDGHAIVRFENTVRDEINYAVQEVNVDVAGIANFTRGKIKKLIGGAKQARVLELVKDKEQLLQHFNTEEAIHRVTNYSWNNYVSAEYKSRAVQQFGGEHEALHEYWTKQLSALRIQGAIFPLPQDDIYCYGVVVFTPHRQGALGIIDGGLYRNAMLQHHSEGPPFYMSDSFGFFMGGGDDRNAATIDTASFKNLDEFIGNRLSVMVATKAFGMGIDKPNVRLTIHMNIPQSIESFVQEAGRAGRDRKLSFSLILFNQQLFPIQDGTRTINDYYLDKDVLMYFHRNSFKGQIKERAMIHELRTHVTFPNITNAQRIAHVLNELYGNDQYQFTVKRGSNNWSNHIFVSANDDITVGNISLIDRTVQTYRNFADPGICNDIMNIVLVELPDSPMTSEAMGVWLKQLIVNTRHETGIERMMETLQTRDSAHLQIPFTNKFYTEPPRPQEQYRLNPAYVGLITSTQAYNDLIQDGHVTAGMFLNSLTTSNQNNETFEEFVDRLQIQDPAVVSSLNSTTTLNRLHICYYKGRSQEDTAKAIYRLISIGVIDAYTIDYHKKLYTVHFTKKENNEYFEAFEQLMARYTSRRAASTRIQELRVEFASLVEQGPATVLSFCLEKLTNFVYEKIREKRLQAIEDMLSLCKEAVSVADDPLLQNELLKDEIFYYFNAKYSRIGYVEPSTGDAASMVDDQNSDLTIREVVEKYIELVEDERTGQFLNNVKHLRGSTMRMIRSYGDEPAYLVLKSFSLLVLSTVIASLLPEAKRDIVKGMIQWKQQDQTFNPNEFIAWLKTKVSEHVDDHFVGSVFLDIKDLYYASYYVYWTKKLTADKLQI